MDRTFRLSLLSNRSLLQRLDAKLYPGDQAQRVRGRRLLQNLLRLQGKPRRGVRSIAQGVSPGMRSITMREPRRGGRSRTTQGSFAPGGALSFMRIRTQGLRPGLDSSAPPGPQSKGKAEVLQQSRRITPRKDVTGVGPMRRAPYP